MPATPPRRPMAGWAAALVAALVLGLVVAGLALSAWQWRRLAWKEALIARIERQQVSPPQALPPAGAALSREADEYRRLQLRGRYDPSREALVLASTELGRGHWVITPLRTDDGRWLLVNRGYVDAEHRAPAAHAAPPGEQAVQGLLRWTEPGGLPWQRNDPTRPEPERRWASRDVAAIGAALGLPAAELVPWFLDLQEGPAAAPPVQDITDTAAGPWPRAGLTVLRFSNNHRSYALTWLALALGAAAAGLWWWREEGARRRAWRTGAPP